LTSIQHREYVSVHNFILMDSLHNTNEFLKQVRF